MGHNTTCALTRSGSEAYLALARETHSGLWPDVEKRIAAGFMYQEDGGSGRLSPSSRPMGSSIKFTLRKTTALSRQRWQRAESSHRNFHRKPIAETIRACHSGARIPLQDVNGILISEKY